MSKETKRLINISQRLYRIYQCTGQLTNQERYKKVRNKLSRAMRHDNIETAKKKITSFKNSKRHSTVM